MRGGRVGREPERLGEMRSHVVEVGDLQRLQQRVCGEGAAELLEDPLPWQDVVAQPADQLPGRVVAADHAQRACGDQPQLVVAVLAHELLQEGDRTPPRR